MGGSRSGRRRGRRAARDTLAAGEEKCRAKAAVSGEAATATADVGTLRMQIKRHLLTFPESAALDAPELDDAVDRIIKESNPSTATPTAQEMVRYDDKRISSAFNLGNWLEIPTDGDLPPTGAFPPGWLDGRRRMLDEEMQPEKRGQPNHSRLHLAKMRVDLLTNGYVEFPRPYVDYMPPFPVSVSKQHKHTTTAVVAG